MARERTGSIVERGSNIYARVTWTDETGRRREITRKAVNRTEARKLIRLLIAKISPNGASKAIDAERLTFDDLANHYEAHYAIPPVYIDGRKVAGLRAYRDVRNHMRILRSYFHRIKLTNISYRTIERFKMDRLNEPLKRNGEQRSLANVHRTLSILRTMLHVAEREEWIIRNPFSAGKPLINMSNERPRERILSREEEERLLSLCAGHREYLRPLLTAALDTGMRRGEILSLCWSDIHFASATIEVRAANTKTERARVVPLTERLMNELMRLQERANGKPHDSVFSIGGTGLPRMIQRMCDEVGIIGFRFHDCRHTFATRLIQAGMPLAEVSKLLGHTTLGITFTHYVNADSTTVVRATELLDRINAGNQTTCLIM